MSLNAVNIPPNSTVQNPKDENRSHKQYQEPNKLRLINFDDFNCFGQAVGSFNLRVLYFFHLFIFTTKHRLLVYALHFPEIISCSLLYCFVFFLGFSDAQVFVGFLVQWRLQKCISARVWHLKLLLGVCRRKQNAGYYQQIPKEQDVMATSSS